MRKIIRSIKTQPKKTQPKNLGRTKRNPVIIQAKFFQSKNTLISGLVEKHYSDHKLYAQIQFSKNVRLDVEINPANPTDQSKYNLITKLNITYSTTHKIQNLITQKKATYYISNHTETTELDFIRDMKAISRIQKQTTPGLFYPTGTKKISKEITITYPAIKTSSNLSTKYKKKLDAVDKNTYYISDIRQDEKLFLEDMKYIHTHTNRTVHGKLLVGTGYGKKITIKGPTQHTIKPFISYPREKQAAPGQHEYVATIGQQPAFISLITSFLAKELGQPVTIWLPLSKEGSVYYKFTHQGGRNEFPTQDTVQR